MLPCCISERFRCPGWRQLAHRPGKCDGLIFVKGNRRQTGKHNTQKRITAWNPDTADSAGYMGSESEVINDDKDGSGDSM